MRITDGFLRGVLSRYGTNMMEARKSLTEPTVFIYYFVQ